MSPCFVDPIARTLMDLRAYASLAALGSSCKQLHCIVQPFITAYKKNCEARFEISDGNKVWRDEEGRIHRYDGPAVVHSDGTMIWYHHGQIHRDERVGGDGSLCLGHRILPAIIFANGACEWFQHGEAHCDERDADGYLLPTIMYANGTRMWHQHGILHRDECGADGKTLPAIIWPSGKGEWYCDGEQYWDV